MKFTNFIKLVIATSAFSIAISSCGPTDDFVGISTFQSGDVLSGSAVDAAAGLSYNLSEGVLLIEDERTTDAAAIEDIQSIVDDFDNFPLVSLVNTINDEFSDNGFILDTDGVSVVIVRGITVSNPAGLLQAEGTEVILDLFTGEVSEGAENLQLTTSLNAFSYIIP